MSTFYRSEVQCDLTAWFPTAHVLGVDAVVEAGAPRLDCVGNVLLAIRPGAPPDGLNVGKVVSSGDMPPLLCSEPLVRIEELLARNERRILLGLTGVPGAGKSTLARRLAEQCGNAAVVVPMDGFHLANAELARLGLSHRKGAPDTFDAVGYIALLRRLRSPEEDVVIYAPAFHRKIEEAVAGSIAVPDNVRLVITEGNYLLSDGLWQGVSPLLDEVWFVEGEEAVRRRRLLHRHVTHGRTPDQARAWIETIGEPNAVLIRQSHAKADRIVMVG